MTTPLPELPAFDLRGPLPERTCVLEASAGTGKTHTIAALAARYVAEGRYRLGQLMMVTFSRAASQELRVRIRERLESTRAALAAGLRGEQPAGTDEVDRLLATGSPEELRARHEAVADALSDFDSATIATTHEFCQRMLDSLGVLATHDPDAVLVENLDELVREVCADEYLRRFGRRDGVDAPPPPFPFADALEVATAVVRAPGLAIVPADDPSPLVRQRVELARAVRAEVERRKRRKRIYTFDDMLSGLAYTLDHPEHGETACTRLRERYPVVLVDEFQDTDPVQWRLVRRAFHGHSTLILIGDPKQAVYAFRGADVHSYLEAVTEAHTSSTLARNWRSDPDMVRAVLALFEGGALGDDRILVRSVEPGLTGSRIRSHSGRYPCVPLRLRVLEGDPQRVGPVRTQIQDDLVGELRALLAGDTELAVDDEGWRPVRASDVAVLVRANERAEQLRQALAAAGVPAVVNGSQSVHRSPAARDWAVLLQTLLEPHQRSVREAALTSLVGWSLDELAAADDQELGDLRRRLRIWAGLLEQQGVAALVEAVSSEQRLAERLLARPGGERLLTDLRHVAEGLHQVKVAEHLGTAALLEWLRTRIRQASADGDERSRRLETDGACVQILTYHHSKGLQFPIVYLPSGWDRHLRDDDGRVLRLHAPDGQRVVDVGGERAEGRRERFLAARDEDSGDDLRLLYVAMTRAQCQVVAWWGPASHNTPSSALHRLLQRDPSVLHPASSYPADASPLQLPGPPRHLVLTEPVAPRAGGVPDTAPAAPTTLGVRVLDRDLDTDWRRTSYTALTAAASHGAAPAPAGVGSEPPPHKEPDEPAPDGPEDVAVPDGAESDPPGADLPSPLADFPGGTAFGSLVHTLLEYVDPAADDLPTALTALAARELQRLPTTPFGARQLAEALVPAMHTPLGPQAGDRTLAGIAAADRLPELDFELPLGGGHRPVEVAATLADVAGLLERHLPADDVLAGYPAALRDPALRGETLRGFLTGSIDAVLRVGPGRERHLVVDYKTNWLGPREQPLRVGHYTRTAMAQAMIASHYPLQALLYAVALHRFLRWRQPGYDPDRHLGGILYLFVRGMTGGQTPLSDGLPCGVFGWHPPSALVLELSDLLAGGPGRRRR